MTKDTAQTEQEPCGWQFYQDGKWHNGMETNNHRANTERAGIPVRDVYPAPQRPWVGLTDEEHHEIVLFAESGDWHDFEVINVTEAKLKENNT